MIRVGLVGYGFMGHMHAQCHTASGDAKIVALADVDPAKRDEAREKYGCETYETIGEMLASAEVDLVDICTPTYLHEEMVIAAAGAGRDIMCEKPMSLTVESCDRMIDAAEKAGVKMMIGQVIRFWPEYQVIKEIVDSGRYGKVRWMSARRLSAFPSNSWQNWYADPKKSSGAILDLHIHDQDYFTYLIGAPTKVDARGLKSDLGAINSVFTLGSGHESGATSFAEGSLDMSTNYPFNMALLVNCEKASIRFDMALDPSLMVFPTEGEPFAPELPDAGIGSSTETSGNISSLGGYYNEIKYYLECLKADKYPEIVTPQAARMAVKICLAAAKSVEQGGPVEL